MKTREDIRMVKFDYYFSKTSLFGHTHTHTHKNQHTHFLVHDHSSWPTFGLNV